MEREKDYERLWGRKREIDNFRFLEVEELAGADLKEEDA